MPETCSEWELKRDIIKYNLRSYVNMKSIAAIFGHTKGSGWFVLPERWFVKPRELWEVFKIGMHLSINIFLTSLPLRLSEVIMTTLNPAMKNRRRVAGYDAATYKTCDWDEDKNLVRIKEASAHTVPISGQDVGFW